MPIFDDEIVAHVSMAHPTSNGLMNACEEAIKKERVRWKKDFRERKNLT